MLAQELTLVGENGQARLCPADLMGDGLGWLYRHLLCVSRGKNPLRNPGKAVV